MRNPVPRPFADDRPLHKHADAQYSLPLIAALEQIANCKYCTSIAEPALRTPIQCIKYAGSQIPISVNFATCHTCGEYKLD
ncbi:hypothetical protein ACFQZT_09055 [Paenibacillus sp. GCM10027628]|uniref:hypothetical protein n=1 Tax=Paenibacillus sp. GCM10027628 TaxID=3273413 RepID=UPI003632C26F